MDSRAFPSTAEKRDQNGRSAEPVALTIAGADPSAGAGIGVDLAVFRALGVHGTFALTAATAQNTRGVHSVQPLPANFVSEQLRTLHLDLPIAAIKTGMLHSAETTRVVAEFLATIPEVPVIVDPVWISESGTPLLEEDAWNPLRKLIFPLAELVTPNRAECAHLLGQESLSHEDVPRAAERILDFGANAVLIKGGHFTGSYAEDYFVSRTSQFTLRSKRLDLGRVHGTGCALSAAIAAERSRGVPLEESVRSARRQLIEWMASSRTLGEGARLMTPRPRVVQARKEES